jgi:hypothetical protein
MWWGSFFLKWLDFIDRVKDLLHPSPDRAPHEKREIIARSS